MGVGRKEGLYDRNLLNFGIMASGKRVSHPKLTKKRWERETKGERTIIQWNPVTQIENRGEGKLYAKKPKGEDWEIIKVG